MPLFIVGFARSGTTLCQNLVSQRLVIPTLPETHFFEFLEAYEPAGGHITPEAAGRLLDDLSKFVDLPDTRFPGLLAEPMVPIQALFLRIVGHEIGSQQLAAQGLWLEKTPGHAEHLERILQMFPKARFLCMIRNPLGAFASRRELMEPGKGWGEEWKPIEAFCSQWAEHVDAVRGFQERHPGALMTIRLEDLAADPETELTRVRQFVGPAYATGVKAPVQHAIIQPFETWKRDALQPADPKIADRAGRSGLDAYETWRVKSLLGERMASFGYDTTTEEPALDDLHRRLLTCIDWYRDAMVRRDELMDVKTARIRSLLNELGEKSGVAVPRRKARPARRGRAEGDEAVDDTDDGDAEGAGGADGAPDDPDSAAAAGAEAGDTSSAATADGAGAGADADARAAPAAKQAASTPTGDAPRRAPRARAGAKTGGAARGSGKPGRAGPKPEADE